MNTAVDSSQISELLENTLRDIGIPPRPAILDRINAEMRKEDPNFKQLGLVIGSDVALAAGLISLANSPFFGFRGRVRSVNEALLMLGLSVTSRAIAGLVFRQMFPVTPLLIRFWDASASIARLSGWLVQHLDNVKTRAEDAYTFGLFRDCGIAVLINRYPEYPSTLKKANAEPLLAFTTIEEAVYPTNHAVIGCLLAQAWWLPEEICLAIRHHHEYPPVGQQNSRVLNMIAISQLAEHLFQHHTGLSETQEWGKASIFCLERLGLDEESLTELYETSATIATTEE